MSSLDFILNSVMAIRLKKGHPINLEKTNGLKLTNFCVGCNWGAVIEKKYQEVVIRNGFLGLGRKTELRPYDNVIDVDLDLSCLMFDTVGNPIDHIYSPLYNFGENKFGLPYGKLDSRDKALHHTGDDQTGDPSGDDGLDNEIITVDLTKINSNVASIVFFLNVFNNKDYSGDFSGVPYAYIRMFEPIMGFQNGQYVVTGVKENFAQYDVSTKTDCKGMRGLVLGKLYRHNEEWKFSAIGDAFPDKSIVHTIARVIRDYSH